MNMTISQAKLEKPGAPIERIEGKIRNLWERKTGSNANGDWSMQSGVLTDSTGDMKFTLSGLPEMRQRIGESIAFRCKEGGKGLSGVKVKLDTYKKDKPEMVLWVTPTAIIFNPDMIQEGADEIPGLPSPKPQQDAPQVNVERKQPISVNGLNEVKHRLMQYVNFRALCDNAVEHLYGEGASDENKKDVSSCFFIQGMREGLERKLPDNKPIEKKEEVKKEDLENGSDLF